MSIERQRLHHTCTCVIFVELIGVHRHFMKQPALVEDDNTSDLVTLKCTNPSCLCYAMTSTWTEKICRDSWFLSSCSSHLCSSELACHFNNRCCTGTLPQEQQCPFLPDVATSMKSSQTVATFHGGEHLNIIHPKH